MLTNVAPAHDNNPGCDFGTDKAVFLFVFMHKLLKKQQQQHMNIHH